MCFWLAESITEFVFSYYLKPSLPLRHMCNLPWCTSRQTATSNSQPVPVDYRDPMLLRITMFSSLSILALKFFWAAASVWACRVSSPLQALAVGWFSLSLYFLWLPLIHSTFFAKYIALLFFFFKYTVKGLGNSSWFCMQCPSQVPLKQYIQNWCIDTSRHTQFRANGTATVATQQMVMFECDSSFFQECPMKLEV